MANRNGKPNTYRSSQEIDNASFDESYQVETSAAMGYRADIDAFVPLAVNADGSLKTSASLSGGGGDGAILDGSNSAIKATVKQSSTDATKYGVVVVNPDGSNIGGGGGGSGTQYADGAARGTATGTIMMVDDGTNIQSAKGDSAGRLEVNVNGTVPVSGTVSTGLSQPLTDTQLRATAVPVSGTFFQATQPVSATALPLPTGASTSAKQPALGTAGTASTDVLTVQGIASMTPIKVDGSGVTQPVSGTVTITPSGTQTVSGTVTANIGTAGTLALDATLTGGTQKAIARGGAKGTTTAADVTSTNVDANTQAMDVSVKGTAAISAASLPLPTGAATETTLSALNTKVTAVNTGAVTISSALPTGANAIGSITNTSFAATQATASNLNAQVQGAGANGAALVGNPVLVAGSDGTNARSLKVDSTGTISANVGGQAGAGSAATGFPVLIAGSDGTNVRYIKTDTTGNTVISGLPTAAAPTDTFANPTVTHIAVENMVFNGTTWDRMRAALGDAGPATGTAMFAPYLFNGSTYDRQRGLGVALTTGDTGAKTATGNGATQTNVGNKGIQIVINMGAVTGTTPTCTLKVQGSVDATNFYDIPGATTAALTATGIYGITIYPGATVLAGTTTTGTTAVASNSIPRSWRMAWTIGGTTPSFTITSITYNYLAN